MSIEYVIRGVWTLSVSLNCKNHSVNSPKILKLKDKSKYVETKKRLKNIRGSPASTFKFNIVTSFIFNPLAKTQLIKANARINLPSFLSASLGGIDKYSLCEAKELFRLSIFLLFSISLFSY